MTKTERVTQELKANPAAPVKEIARKAGTTTGMVYTVKSKLKHLPTAESIPIGSVIPGAGGEIEALKRKNKKLRNLLLSVLADEI